MLGIEAEAPFFITDKAAALLAKLTESNKSLLSNVLCISYFLVFSVHLFGFVLDHIPSLVQQLKNAKIRLMALICRFFLQQKKWFLRLHFSY